MLTTNVESAADKVEFIRHVCPLIPNKREMEEECPVCFHTVPQTQFQCGHRMCPRCTHKMLHHDGRCPLCRITITSCNPVLIDCTGFPNSFYIDLVRTMDDERFGITMETDMTITRVERDSIAYAAGVRRKHMILEVNGMPCYNNKVVSTMFRQRGVFRICLHHKPEVMYSSRCKGGNVWMRWFASRRRRTSTPS